MAHLLEDVLVLKDQLLEKHALAAICAAHEVLSNGDTFDVDYPFCTLSELILRSRASEPTVVLDALAARLMAEEEAVRNDDRCYGGTGHRFLFDLNCYDQVTNAWVQMGLEWLPEDDSQESLTLVRQTLAEGGS